MANNKSLKRLKAPFHFRVIEPGKHYADERTKYRMLELHRIVRYALGEMAEIVASTIGIGPFEAWAGQDRLA